MRYRAIALSALAHFTLLGAIAWRSFSRPSPSALQIQAPLGDVFAEEGRRSSRATPLTRAIPATRSADAANPFMPAAGGAPAPAGLPEGEAKPVGAIRPRYPPLSRKLGEEGEALFALRIAPSGAVQEAALVKSSGHSRLDEAAKTALLAARFQNENGTAVLKRFRVEFRLSR